MKAMFRQHGIICSQHVEQVKSSIDDEYPRLVSVTEATRFRLGVLEKLLHVFDKLGDKVLGLYYRNNNSEKCTKHHIGIKSR